MKIILGLGNPGAEYANTRHNAGLLFVDQMFNRQSSTFNNLYGWRRRKNIFVAEFPELALVKTAGYFMNESGGVIREFFQNSPNPVEDFYLAHDDLDLRLGEYKIQFGKGPKEHNGVGSVESQLGTKEFWRIRIGIDARQDNVQSADEASVSRAKSNVQRVLGEEYVLQKFLKGEREVLDKVLEKISAEIFQ